MTDEERDRFLRDPRYGILTLLRTDGSPISVPVWFDWTGQVVRMFTSAVSPKIERLKADPRVSLLVANHIAEHEMWVAFDGVVSIHEEGGIELAEKLASRYWDLSDPDRQRTLEFWQKVAAALRVLELEPTRIRTYKDEVPAA
jgi:PPOX class probable F420-dependent enzyme